MKVKKTIIEEHSLKISGITLLTIPELSLLTANEKKFLFPWWLNSKNPTVMSEDGKTTKTSDSAAIRPVLKIDNLKESGLKIGDVFEINHFVYNKFRVISETKAFCISDKTIGKYSLKDNKVYDEHANCSLLTLKEILDDIYKVISAEN